MEDFDFDFDDNGLPRWPQWFVSEKAMAEFRAQMNHGTLTPEQTQRQAELVARKRKEFDEERVVEDWLNRINERGLPGGVWTDIGSGW